MSGYVQSSYTHFRVVFSYGTKIYYGKLPEKFSSECKIYGCVEGKNDTLLKSYNPNMDFIQ